MTTLNPITVRRLAILLGSIVLAACTSGTDAAPSIPSDPATETFASSLGVNISQMTKTSLGDYYKEVTLGTGTTLTATQTTAYVTYKGYLKTGTLFDSSSFARFRLDSVIIGFRDGLVGMKTGGDRQLVIPSDLGFGPFQTGPLISPNSTLIFTVHLDSVP
jgi:FKBP-type peptidyl-prolyl cis-trans isomerase